MQLKGDFEGLFLASILQLLSDDRKTGVLRVTSGDNESKVFFDAGTIVYATGSQKEARLGYILRQNGIISEEALHKCLGLAKETNQALGKLLVAKGFVSVETLNKYNTKQVEEILYNMLQWKTGRFEYEDAELKLEGMVITRLQPMGVILEAARRIDEMSVLKEQIPSDKIVLKISNNGQKNQGVKLDANEWRILSFVDGRRTVREIIDESGYDEFAVYKILYSVISYGLLEKKEEVRLGEGAGGDDYSSIITVYLDIFQVVRRHVESELGSHAADLFVESRSSLEPRYQDLFKDFHPEHPEEVNQKALIATIGALEDPVEGRGYLINGLNQYCATLLDRVASILGTQPIQDIIHDIEKVIDYVDRYQAGSAEKDKIVNNARKILRSLDDRTGRKKGAGKAAGVFSLFRKR